MPPVLKLTFKFRILTPNEHFKNILQQVLIGWKQKKISLQMEEKSLKFVKMADNQPKGSDSKKLLFIHDLENSVDFPYKPFPIKGYVATSS